jgi:NADH pyrophosphatase NudC (nudix superfamily)
MKYCPECREKLERDDAAMTERFICTSADCGFVFWKNPTPVVAGLVQCDGQYILGRNAAWPNGLFSMFTGFLEPAETPEQGIIREIEEELGLQTIQTEFIGHFPLPKLNQLIIAYAVEARGQVVLNHEIAEILLLTPEELLAFDFGPLTLTRQVLRQWQVLSEIPSSMHVRPD